MLLKRNNHETLVLFFVYSLFVLLSIYLSIYVYNNTLMEISNAAMKNKKNGGLTHEGPTCPTKARKREEGRRRNGAQMHSFHAAPNRRSSPTHTHSLSLRSIAVGSSSSVTMRIWMHAPCAHSKVVAAGPQRGMNEMNELIN